MKVRLSTTRSAAASPERLFDFTNDAANFTSFTGYGPIPSIRRAFYETPGEPRLGSIRRIVKSDGTEHAEEIVAFERPRRHNSRITGLGPPFSWLVRFGEDDWVFTPEGSGTRIDRTFSFELTTIAAAPLAWLILQTLMRGAVRRDLDNILTKLA